MATQTDLRGTDIRGTSDIVISAVETVPFQIPYRRPMAFANGLVSAAEHVLVRILTDAGLVGVAEAPPRPMTYGESQASIMTAIQRWIAPALIGRNIVAAERIVAATASLVGNNTAKAAVDLALWDLLGQAASISCHSLLGGYAHRLRVTHMLGFATPGEVAEEAAEVQAKYGVDSFKLKVGRGVATDVETCRAVREAVGDAALIYLDANHGYVAEDAIKACREMTTLGAAWVEEPTPAADRIGRSLVANSLDIPVMGDESCSTLGDVAREVSGGAVRMVSIKTARTGFTVSGRILGLCEGLGARVLCGNQLDGVLGTAATLAFGAAHAATAEMPAELSHFLLHEDDVVAEPLHIADGYLTVSDRPGVGVTVDEKKLARYRVEI